MTQSCRLPADSWLPSPGNGLGGAEKNQADEEQWILSAAGKGYAQESTLSAGVQHCQLTGQKQGIVSKRLLLWQTVNQRPCKNPTQESQTTW